MGYSRLAPPARTRAEDLIRRGIRFAGLKAGLMGAFVEEFATLLSIPGWLTSFVGSGSWSVQVAGSEGGEQRLFTGATANSRAANFSQAYLLPNLSTKRFYLGWRGKIETAMTATARAGCGVESGNGSNHTVMAGFNGALNANNYIVQYGGAFGGSALDLQVAITTGYRLFEVYGRGDGVLRARLDKGIERSVNISGTNTDCYMMRDVANGANAGDRQLRQTLYVLMWEES